MKKIMENNGGKTRYKEGAVWYGLKGKEEPSRHKAGEGAFQARKQHVQRPWGEREAGELRQRGGRRSGSRKAKAGVVGSGEGRQSLDQVWIQGQGEDPEELYTDTATWWKHLLTASFWWHMQSQGQRHPGLHGRAYLSNWKDTVTAVPQLKSNLETGVFRAAFV